MADRHVDFLLVGGGLASANCARWLREEGAEGSILLVGREPEPPYNRPPCSKGYLQGTESREDTYVRPQEWWEEASVELLTRTSVLKLDTEDAFPNVYLVLRRTTDADRPAVLDLLKRALTGALYEDSDYVLGGKGGVGGVKHRIANRVGEISSALGVEMVRKRPYDPKLREHGLDRPGRAESMIGLRRMSNIQDCVESVIQDGIPGDLIETGVWRGGATIFMRAVLLAHGDTARTVWVADSFEGLPKPNAVRYPADEGDGHHEFEDLRVGVDQVKHNFSRYGLLDDQVKFLVGWFRDTLPMAPIDHLAVMRLDGDMYESTIQAFEALYTKLSVGGYCIIDDYGLLPGAKYAVHAFRNSTGITEEIKDIDGVGVYWRKTA